MTRQVSDKLIYINEEYPLLSVIPLPKNDERLVKITDEESELLTEYHSSTHAIYCSTACWRGYIATWEIKEDILYLKEVSGKCKLLSDSPIVADWFSNTVKIGLGHLLDSTSILASGDIYAKELHIIIENGVVRHTKAVEFNEEYVTSDGTVKSRPKDRRSIQRKFIDGDFDNG